MNAGLQRQTKVTINLFFNLTQLLWINGLGVIHKHLSRQGSKNVEDNYNGIYEIHKKS